MITLAKLLFTLLLQWQGNHPELTQFLYKNTTESIVGEVKTEIGMSVSTNDRTFEVCSDFFCVNTSL